MTFNGSQGHLATITSASEREFVNGLVTQGNTIANSGYWLGGFQDTRAPDYAEPDGGWRWVTGEPFNFTDWVAPEPNNFGMGEGYLELGVIFDGASGWNDNSPCSFNSDRYIVEFSDATSFNPTNGHSYMLVPGALCWDQARAAAESFSGDGFQAHLATITSADEQDFLNSVLPPVGRYWLGGYQDITTQGFSEPDGGWRWTTGEAFTFTDWTSSEPNNTGPGGASEEYLELTFFPPTFTGWNDNIQCSQIVTGYVIEFSNTFGTNYCQANNNSSGTFARTRGFGSASVAANDFILRTTGLPANQFGFYVTSPNQGFAANVGGGEGNLCLGSPVGRIDEPSQILNSGALGQAQLQLSLQGVPLSSGPVDITPGETWNFQFWHRDSNPTPTSNLSEAVSILFMP